MFRPILRLALEPLELELELVLPELTLVAQPLESQQLQVEVADPE